MKQKKSLALLLAMLMLISILTTGCRDASRSGKVADTSIKNADRAEKETSADRPASSSAKKSGKEMSSEEIAEYLQTRVVKVENSDGSIGSGFFIDDEGTIVTNYHVIEGATSIGVVLHDGAIYEVTSIADFSPFHDVAVLNTDISGNDYLTISDEYKQGAAVYAMGSPKNYESTFTSGTISSTSRIIGLVDCIQIDAAINPGNSGGPVVNSKGQVLGINSMIRTDAQNIGFSIKMSVLDELDMDKNYTLNRYAEWYDKETGRSYMATEDNKTFYNTYVNTYTTVTGQECLYSTDDGNSGRDGYSIMYLFYTYEYDTQSYDAYCDYLRSIGFEYDGTSREMGLDGVSYVHAKEGYTMLMLIDTVDNIIMVSCPIY